MQLVWDYLAGVALVEIVLVAGGVLAAMWKAFRERRQTGSPGSKLAEHVWWVGPGVIVSLLGYGSLIAQDFGDPQSVGGAPTAVVGLSMVLVGLYRLRSYQHETYQTLGGSGEKSVPSVAYASIGIAPLTLFIILAVSQVVGFYASAGHDQDIVESQREGCRQTNVLRQNQSRGLKEQIEQTDASLEGDLGTLEDFRDEIMEANEKRKLRLAELKKAASDFPLRGDPYQVDCGRAYPDP